MVIVKIWEGLGNQLFQYAYARALIERGFDVLLDVGGEYTNTEDKDYLNKFNTTIPYIDSTKMWQYRYLLKNSAIDKYVYDIAKEMHWLFPLYEEKNAFYTRESFNPPKMGYLKGWFQSEKYFADIRDILLKELSLKKPVKLPISLRDTFDKNITVSIHIRRGDYVRVGMALNELYYIRAIDRIKDYYEEPVFLVFSDDIKWVKKYIPLEKFIYISEEFDFRDYEELWLMTLCKANIISNSTFSWWGAWLNNDKDKKVIAPRRWLSSQSGIVPENWEVI